MYGHCIRTCSIFHKRGKTAAPCKIALVGRGQEAEEECAIHASSYTRDEKQRHARLHWWGGGRRQRRVASTVAEWAETYIVVINLMWSWVRIIRYDARGCVHDYTYYYLTIRSSLSIRHVKLVARQRLCSIIGPVIRISPAYG